MCHFDMEDMCVTVRCYTSRYQVRSDIDMYRVTYRCLVAKIVSKILCNPTSHRELGGIVNTQKAYHIHQVTHSSKKVYFKSSFQFNCLPPHSSTLPTSSGIFQLPFPHTPKEQHKDNQTKPEEKKRKNKEEKTDKTATKQISLSLFQYIYIKMLV